MLGPNHKSLAITWAGAALTLGATLHTACSSDSSPSAPAPLDSGVDGNIIIVPPPSDGGRPPCKASDPFGKPQRVPGLLDHQEYARLTPNERTIYVNWWGSDSDIFVSKRENTESPFEKANPVEKINSSKDDEGVWVDSENKTLLFGSNRSGTWTIYRAARNNTLENFGDPTPVAGLGITGNLAFPFVLEWNELWFSSDAAGGGDIYRSTITDGTFNAARPEASLNDPSADDARPVLSRDGLVVFFASTRTGSLAKHDIWTASRTSPTAVFGPVSNVTILNEGSAGEEYPDWVSEDGCRLYMTSDRTGVRVVYVAERQR